MISLVLATKDRSKILARTLERLAELDASGFEIQVIVADNGSSDDTQATLAAAKDRCDLTSVFVETAGKNRALNKALEFADGDLVVFTDDDVLPATDWLSELVAASNRWPEAEIIGGQTLLAAPPGTPEWLFETGEHALNFARYAPSDTEGLTGSTPFGPNFAVRRSLLTRFAFDENTGPDGTPGYAMGSETDFLLRASREGAQTVYVPSAKLWHIVRPEQLTRRSMSARSYRFGRGWARVREPAPSVSYLLGAPRWLWRDWLRAGVDRISTSLSPERDSLEPLLRYHRIRGLIAEYRDASGQD